MDQSVDHSQVLGFLQEAFARDQWIHILILSLPLWFPLVAFYVVGLWKGNVEVALLASASLGVRRFFMSIGALFAISSIWRLITPPGTFQRVVTRVAALTGAAKPPPCPTRARNSNTEAKTRAPQPKAAAVTLQPVGTSNCQASSSQAESTAGARWAVREEDLLAFKHRIDEGYKTEKWEVVSEKKTDKINYIAYRHILPHGGTEYLSKTVVQNSNAEAMHAFYDDDQTRMQWDNMLQSAEEVDKCSVTDSAVSLWTRNFPVCCSQRDYLFCRRNFDDGEYLWTITKACLHPSKPEQKTPRRVTEYFSSWRIRTVPGIDGQLSASECVLIHHEEMGIQQDMARWAIRQGMWGVIKNLVKGYYKFHVEWEAKKASLASVARVQQIESVAASSTQGAQSTGTTPVEIKAPRKRRGLLKIASMLALVTTVLKAESKRKGRRCPSRQQRFSEGVQAPIPGERS
ncbi:hypothetical protein CYMTET_21769 [Cymbomonas tetramitiformis]|uniref:START domain-containing protein n=1 Tax=Cymbomonas tetramitiformis TaxID=36881 RepID=A0AAE0L2U8_9CHLO|nr:hypothetical protein CYMTET_21769 [Cymbomonas tetramitiformis]